MRDGAKASMLALLMATAALVAGVLAIAHPSSAQGADVLRVLPDTARCGETVQVTLEVSPPSTTDAWILDEVPPEDATVSDVDSRNMGEQVDSGHIKWVSTSGEPATHTYNVTLPSEMEDGEVLTFAGEYRFDPGMDQRADIGGETDLAVTCGSVTRDLPRTAGPGDTVTVELSVDPAEGHDSWVIDEVPPDDVTVENVDSRFSGEHVSDGHVKWVSTSGDAATVTYDVKVPQTATEGTVYTFAGEYRFDPGMDARADIAGDTSLKVTRSDRVLPGSAACDDTFDVTVTLHPRAGTESWLAEEVLPDGWTASADGSSDGLATQTDTGIKFTGAGDGTVTLTYEVTVPGDAEGSHEFAGTYRFHPSMQHRSVTQGDTSLSVTCTDTGGSGGGGGGGSGATGTDGDTGDDGTSPDTSPDDGPPTNSGPSSTVDATAAPTPAGASSAYEATITGSPGDRITIRTGSLCVPSFDLVLGSALDGARVDVTVWRDNLPETAPTLPRQTDAPCAVEIDVEGDATHEVTLSIEIPASDVPAPSHGLLLHAEDGSWNPIERVQLSQSGNGTFIGTARSACCSLFALGFDRADPLVQLDVPEGPLEGTVNVSAVALDNVAVHRVTFAVDGETVATVPTGGPDDPYTTQIDADAYEGGEHEITATAYDLAGRTSEDSQTRTFGSGDAAPPAGPGGGGGPGGWLVFLAIGLLAMLTVAGAAIYQRGDGGIGPSNGSDGSGGSGPDTSPPGEGGLAAHADPQTAGADGGSPDQPGQSMTEASADAEASPSGGATAEAVEVDAGTNGASVSYPWAITSEPAPSDRFRTANGGDPDPEQAATENTREDASRNVSPTDPDALHEKVEQALRRATKER